jgi:hypothetical protein
MRVSLKILIRMAMGCIDLLMEIDWWEYSKEINPMVSVSISGRMAIIIKVIF